MPEKTVSTIEFNPELLEKALEEAKLSQIQLNEIVGFSHRNTVNKIVRRKREATATDLLKISYALNKNPNDFAKFS